MRIVITSDWHGDKSTDGVERFDDLVEVVDQIVEHTIATADLFLFLGDLSNPYSKNVHRVSALGVRVARRLCDAQIPNIWLTGNHDVVEDRHGSHSLMSIAECGDYCDVVSRPWRVSFEGKVSIIALPFTSLAFNYDPGKFIEDNASYGPAPIIIGHLNIEGIGAGSESGEMARGRSVFWPDEVINRVYPNAHKFNGHYHAAQTFRGIHIPGAPLRFTHGEETNTPRYIDYVIDEVSCVARK